jgi:hypothetical protein
VTLASLIIAFTLFLWVPTRLLEVVKFSRCPSHAAQILSDGRLSLSAYFSSSREFSVLHAVITQLSKIIVDRWA